jgi:IS30 family transposase
VQHEKITLRGAPLRVFGQAAYFRVTMQKYKQIDLKDRNKIKAQLDGGHSQTKIAEIIGVHKSTISRELSRNVATRGHNANEYRPKAAQRKTNNRHRDKRKHIRFTDDLKQQATQAEVTEKLNMTKSVISRMENHAEDIKLSTLTKYAKALGKKVKLKIQ